MIIIPMAGESRRFIEKGYRLPKFMLEIGGQTVFEWTIRSFDSLFNSEKFVFIVKKSCGAYEFVKEKVDAWGIKNYNIVELDLPTRGQAETVHLGLAEIDISNDPPITIHNIDTFRPRFRYPTLPDGGVSFLETFIGSGKNWSNVEPDQENSGRVKRTAEKQEISPYCCTGVYHFQNASLFEEAFLCAGKADMTLGGELYVAPLYNRLIARKIPVNYFVISREQVIFCGVPYEYEQLKAEYEKNGSLQGWAN